MIGQTLLVALLFSGFGAPSTAQNCLHGSNSTPEQQARKRAALAAARQVNTLQAAGVVKKRGAYLSQLEMAEGCAKCHVCGFSECG